MTKAARNFILIMAALVLCAFASKIFWDDYQMKRAMAQNPKVVGLLNQIEPFPTSSRVPSEYEGPSTNEYASSVWRYYRANSKCSDVQAHLDAEAVRNGFEFESVQRYSGNKEVFHQRGEYEMRALFEPQTDGVCSYAVSVNWYAAN